MKVRLRKLKPEPTPQIPDAARMSAWLITNPHLPSGRPKLMADQFQQVAGAIEHVLQLHMEKEIDEQQAEVGWQKLLEAKDCFVRAVLDR